MDDSALESIIGLAKEEQGVITPALRARLEEIANEAQRIDSLIATKEEEVKRLKATKHNIEMKVLPAVMIQVGLKKITTSNGIDISMETIVSGSLPKQEEDRKRAIEIINEAGGGGLLVSEVSISFGKGQEEDARRVVKAIGALGYNHAQHSSSIHPQTLCAWVRELMRDGKTVDTDKIGVFIADRAKVKAGKDYGK